jgi:hypothetical protein
MPASLLQALIHEPGPGQEFFDIDAHHGRGQKAHRGEHRKPAAHRGRHAQGEKALLFRQLPQSPLFRVRGDDEAFPDFFLTDAVFKHLEKKKKLGQGFGGASRFADDVHHGAAELQGVQNPVHKVRVDVVQDPQAGFVLAPAQGQLVMLGVAQGLVQGSGAQGGAADAQNDKFPAPFQERFGHLADFLDDLTLVGQLIESQTPLLPALVKVFMDRGHPGIQGLHVFQA